MKIACSPPDQDVHPDADANIPVGRAHLVEFVSPYCSVCAKTSAVIAKLERECTGNDGTVVRVDVETPAGRALAERFDVHAVPTFLQLDAAATVLTRLIGEQSPENLAISLGSIRGEACPVL